MYVCVYIYTYIHRERERHVPTLTKYRICQLLQEVFYVLVFKSHFLVTVFKFYRKTKQIPLCFREFGAFEIRHKYTFL